MSKFHALWSCVAALGCTGVHAQTCFQRTTIPTGPWPTGLSIGNFFGSGRPDIAYTVYGVHYADGLGSVNVLRNLGGGQFAPAVSINRGKNPAETLFVDLDGDGQLELVALNYPQGTVDLFRNISGTMTYWRSITLLPGMSGVAAIDLDGNGLKDLVIGLVTARRVAVLFNFGQGQFSLPTYLPVVHQAVTVCVGDMDGDQIPDIVVGTGEAGGISGTVLIRNHGDGSFDAAEEISPRGSRVDIGDMNGDGVPDLVVTSIYDPSGDDWIGVCINDGTGHFAAPTMYPVTQQPWNVRVADFDSDGHNDVLVDNYFQSSFSVFLNIGGGMLSQQYSMTTAPGGPAESVIADFNGDGRLDVCTAGGYFSSNVFLHIAAAPTISVTPSLISVQIGQPVEAFASSNAGPGAVFYWTRNGIPVSAADSRFRIPHAALADAGEYRVRAATECGTTAELTVILRVALCRVDWNKNGELSVQDIFDFLSAWFALDPRADFNGVSGITPQDIFDFLSAWFAGC